MGKTSSKSIHLLPLIQTTETSKDALSTHLTLQQFFFFFFSAIQQFQFFLLCWPCDRLPVGLAQNTSPGTDAQAPSTGFSPWGEAAALLLGDQAQHPIPKGAPIHPMNDPQLMTIFEDKNKDQPINCENSAPLNASTALLQTLRHSTSTCITSSI